MMKQNEQVILVNEQDIEIGTLGKEEAHRIGAMHRAFSVFIFNSKGELLLQKRAATKYHSAGLWTNTCCGHPRPNEPVEKAAQRRLFEEMGFTVNLEKLFSFTYSCKLDNEMSEYEFDHVFYGHYDQIVSPSPEEVAAFKYVALDDIEHDVKANPSNYTYWFKLIISNVNNYIKTLQSI